MKDFKHFLVILSTLFAFFLGIKANLTDSVCDDCNDRVDAEINAVEQSKTELFETYEELCHKIQVQEKRDSCVKSVVADFNSLLSFYEKVLKNHCKNTYYCDGTAGSQNFHRDEKIADKYFINKMSPMFMISGPWDACDQCKEFIKYVRSTMKDAQENYIQTNDKFCVQIEDKSKQDLCKQKGRVESQQLFDKFNSFYDPELFCKSHFFCDQQLGSSTNVHEGVQCTWCKQLIGYFNDLIKSGKSKDEVRKEMYNVCDNMWVLKGKCTEFVDAYIDKIYDLITNGADSDQVCVELYLCVTQSQKMKLPSETECVICEFVVAKIDAELNDKNVTEHLKQEIRNICSKMPQTISKECQQFIDYYYNMIIMMIETTKPADMCGAMKLCPMPNADEQQTSSIKVDQI